MGKREAGMMITTGSQGVGKTYQNMHLIKNYVRDKVSNKVRGRKCLIFDTNGEYTADQFKRNDIDNFEPKKLKLSDVRDWSLSPLVECRRIDASEASITQKKEAIFHIMKNFRNGLLVLEDINTYILMATHVEELVSGLVNLRHRAVDVLISYQALRAVEPLIYRNARWVRIHNQNDNVTDIKGKIPELKLYSIAQLIVKQKNLEGDKRFFLYVHNGTKKIDGAFSLNDFELAVRQYLWSNESMIKKYKKIHQIKSDDEAIKRLTKEYTIEYYGND